MGMKEDVELEKIMRFGSDCPYHIDTGKICPDCEERMDDGRLCPDEIAAQY